ncbi:Cerato-platanin [Boletus edulis]|uniref:Cerato-platanin n=1 Tax=Boletus edulis BED1 TaxID=1328754 RepID=A0AAD4BRM6_BOLED|nr:Cerato-platanin [Boletus edulis]KAF8414537.1 Cerato-platanin [Boletus edulis BED1]KAF8437598.1 Cerato-platanin [Boletus edulis BED1]
MKFASLATALLALVLPTLAQTTVQSVSYDTTYDNPSTSLSTVACSNGVHGLETKGYTTFGSLHGFPYIGGAYTVTGWNSPACGTCYSLTWRGTTIYVLAVDVGLDGFNISEEAMNALTGGLAVELGRVNANTTLVAASYCKL